MVANNNTNGNSNNMNNASLDNSQHDNVMEKLHPTMHNTEFPTDSEHRVYHVGVKMGEVANRLITVGDPARAILLASFLDGASEIDASKYKNYLDYSTNHVWIFTSKRLFTTVTGRYRGVPVTIMAIGMGMSMMDFFVREVRAVVQGPLHIIRFGSCGALGSAKAGDMVVANESIACLRNYAYFSTDLNSNKPLTEMEFATSMDAQVGPYQLSEPCASDMELTQILTQSLMARVPKVSAVHVGMDVTADSFYSSQARVDPTFIDENAHLFAYLRDRFSKRAECLQMETYTLFHLAHCAREIMPNIKSIRTASCAMVFAHRLCNTWIDPALALELERKAGLATLDAIVAMPMNEKLLQPIEGSVWATIPIIAQQ